MKHKLILLFVLVFFQVSTILAQGCSQCKLLAKQGSEVDEASFGTNINSGILYLMIIPYLLLVFLFRKQIFGFIKGFFTPAKQG
jgi:hypothetical protein